MKIDSNASIVQANAYIKQIRQQQQAADTQLQQGQPGGTGGADKVELSPEARLAQQAMHELKTMPDTRSEKVAQVKMEIENGTYKVSGERAATGMLKEAFENDTILQKINTKA